MKDVHAVFLQRELGGPASRETAQLGCFDFLHD